MTRVHRITHPRLGPATWKQMQTAAKEVSNSRGFKVCTWCWGPIPKNHRTRCRNPNCGEMMWRAQSWQHCASVFRRTHRGHGCALCKCQNAEFEIDHIVPVSLGGTGDLTNLRLLCSDPCHKSVTQRLRVEKGKYRA